MGRISLMSLIGLIDPISLIGLIRRGGGVKRYNADK